MTIHHPITIKISIAVTCPDGAITVILWTINAHLTCTPLIAQNTILILYKAPHVFIPSTPFIECKGFDIRTNQLANHRLLDKAENQPEDCHC